MLNFHQLKIKHSSSSHIIAKTRCSTPPKSQKSDRKNNFFEQNFDNQKKIPVLKIIKKNSLQINKSIAIFHLSDSLFSPI